MNKKEKDVFNRKDKRPFISGTNLNYIKASANHRKDNESGYKGVCWDKYHNKYKAYIQISNQFINLGHFKHIEDAIKARKEAEKKYHTPVLEKYAEQFSFLVTYKDEQHTLREWSQILNIPYSTLIARYNKHSDNLDLVFSNKNQVHQIIVEYKGEKHSLRKWSKILNVEYRALLGRYKRNLNNLDRVFKEYNQKS